MPFLRAEQPSLCMRSSPVYSSSPTAASAHIAEDCGGSRRPMAGVDGSSLTRTGTISPPALRRGSVKHYQEHRSVNKHGLQAV